LLIIIMKYHSHAMCPPHVGIVGARERESSVLLPFINLLP
jgi:hypothetical protein